MNKRALFKRLSHGLLFSITLTLSQLAEADPSQAVTFASQAGVIAGAAQACGQPIGLMTSRTKEVLNALAFDPTDVTNSTAAYQRAIEDSAASQGLSQQLSCSKVVADFNALPLLRPDYNETVIAPLLKDKPPSTIMPSVTPVAASAMTSAPIPASSAPAASTYPVNNAMMSAALTQQPVPAQQVVSADSSGSANSANSVASGTQQNPATDADKLKLAMQLTQMAQNLLANTPQGQAQLQQQNMQSIPYPERNSIYNQYANAPDNVDAQHNGTNNPAYNKPLGVEPYPPGQSMNTAMAIINSPGTQPYPTTTNPSSTAQTPTYPSYPP